MTELDIKRKLNEAEENYKAIEKAWCSVSDIRSRIDALLELAREVKSYDALRNSNYSSKRESI